jgi:uncharacterized protein involved in exopolysaccharide biosynthesis
METRARENQSNDYEEIDLREVLATLGRWKYKISAFTLICMLLSGIVSWFFLKPVYEAKVVVGFSSGSQLTGSGNYSYIINNNPNNSSSKISDNMDELVKLAQVDAGKYSQLLTSVVVLQRTIDQLGLADKIDELNKKITIVDAKEKNGVKDISVDAPTPELASNIANTLVNQSILYLDEINNRQMESLRKTLETQLASVNKKLDSSFIKLKENQLKSVPPGSAVEQSAAAIKTQIDKNRLENEVQRNEDVANSLNSKILELELFKSLNSAKNLVTVLSPAVVPESPVKPNKKLNVAIAGVLGLMLSIMGVFVLEYLRSEKVPLSKE